MSVAYRDYRERERYQRFDNHFHASVPSCFEDSYIVSLNFAIIKSRSELISTIEQMLDSRSMGRTWDDLTDVLSGLRSVTTKSLVVRHIGFPGLLPGADQHAYLQALLRVTERLDFAYWQRLTKTKRDLPPIYRIDYVFDTDLSGIMQLLNLPEKHT